MHYLSKSQVNGFSHWRNFCAVRLGHAPVLSTVLILGDDQHAVALGFNVGFKAVELIVVGGNEISGDDDIVV